MNKIQFLKSESKWWYYVSFAGLAIVVLTYRLLLAFNYTPEIVNGETNNIWNAFKVINGHRIYSNPETIPFEIFQYTPLSQLPVYLLSWVELTFIDAENFLFTLTVGRILCVLYNIFSFYLVFKILTDHLSVSKMNALLGSLSGLCVLPHHFFAIRPDSMALFLTILGTFFFTKSYFQSNKKSLLASAFFLALSFFVKQDAFLICGAFGLILLLNKNYKSFAIFSICLISFLGLLLLLSPFLLGPYFYKSIFGGINLSMKFEQFYYVLTRYISFYYVILLTSLIMFWKLFKSKEITLKIKLFLTISVLFNFFISFFTTFKEGSHINYYALSTVFLLISITFIFDKIIECLPFKIQWLIPIYFVFISIHFLFFQFYHYTSQLTKTTQLKAEYDRYFNENLNELRNIKQTHSKVISFDNRARLTLSNQIIFPNSEFYGLSRFSYHSFSNEDKKQQVKYLIIPTNLELPKDYLLQFGIDGRKYFCQYTSTDLKIYKYGHR